ncbi:MAG: hypothetical protein ACK5GO_02635 [Ignavibacteria bacterium]|jgi:hypothetical protein
MSKLLMALVIILFSIGKIEASTVKVKKSNLLTSNSTSVKVSLILGCDGEKDFKPDVLANGGVTEVCYDGCTIMRKYIITGAKGKSVSIKLYSESAPRLIFITSFDNFSGKYEIVNGKTCDFWADDSGNFIEVNVDGSIVHKSEIMGIGCM